LFSAEIFRTRGCSSDADVRIFWSKKLRTFRNLWCVRTDKVEGSWASADIFRTSGEGEPIFRDFADAFNGRLLSEKKHGSTYVKVRYASTLWYVLILSQSYDLRYVVTVRFVKFTSVRYVGTNG